MHRSTVSVLFEVSRLLLASAFAAGLAYLPAGMYQVVQLLIAYIYIR